MEKWKEILKKIFFLKPLSTVLIALSFFAFVLVMLIIGNDGTVLVCVLSYISYVLSAYALVITVTGFLKIVRLAKTGFGDIPVIRKIQGTRIGKLFCESAEFRSNVSLHQRLFINLLYVALKLISGIWYRSVWLISLGIYYLLLSVMRIILVNYVHKKAVGEDIRAEFKRYRACGIVLVLMNQALTGIVIYIVHRNQGFLYPGFLIYGMAMYAFYSIITAIINVITFRKFGSPILSAAKVIDLTAALVSMLSLETAMLSEFGGDDFAFRMYMTGISGAVVCTFVLGMAIYMIWRYHLFGR